MKTTSAVIFLALALSWFVGCDPPPTPPPEPLGTTISIRVFVVRSWDDSGLSPRNRIGYAYSDNDIVSIINAMKDRSELIAGQKINFSWPGNAIQELSADYSDVNNGQHFWWPYTIWIDRLRAVYEPNRIAIVFVPGIMDASDPPRFMDSYSLDPNQNNDDEYWDDHPWKPMILISDCKVWHGDYGGPVNEAVDHTDNYHMISATNQRNHFIVDHALGRYLLRQEGLTGWDGQENSTGSSNNYMRRWNDRHHPTTNKTSGIFQGAIWQRINSGNWNNP